MLTIAVFYLARLALSLRSLDLPLSVPAWYLPLTGAIWGGLASALGLGLLRGSPAARRFTPGAAVVYWVWYWADRLLLVQTDFAQRSRPAALVVTVVSLILIVWALSRPSARAFFEERFDG